jgi:hypothetical protein
MRVGAGVAVVILALKEEQSICTVPSAIRSWVDDVIVVDNDSTDKISVLVSKSLSTVTYSR